MGFAGAAAAPEISPARRSGSTFDITMTVPISTDTPVPLPRDWAAIYAALASASRERPIRKPPPPLILAGAAFSSARQIRRRWLDLIEWTNSYGYQQVFLTLLPSPPDFDVASHFAGAAEDGSGWWDDPYRLDDLFEALVRASKEPSEFKPPSGWGIYAWFLRDGDNIAGFPAGPEGLIYIGRSDNLADRELRQHLQNGQTPFSTFRRSLGALLKGLLSLNAIPRRIPPQNNKDFAQFSFTEEGEQALTAWMRQNLTIGAVVRDDPRDVEPLLIEKMKPVLNLKLWQNPNRTRIMALRRVCSEEARG